MSSPASPASLSNLFSSQASVGSNSNEAPQALLQGPHPAAPSSDLPQSDSDDDEDDDSLTELEDSDGDNGGFPHDQAEEHDSDPSDGDTEVAGSDEEGEELDDADDHESESDNAHDDGADLGNWEQGDMETVTEGSSDTDEASTECSDSQESVPNNNAAAEQHNALHHPEDEFIPGAPAKPVVQQHEDTNDDSGDEGDVSDQANDSQASVMRTSGDNQIPKTAPESSAPCTSANNKTTGKKRTAASGGSTLVAAKQSKKKTRISSDSEDSGWVEIGFNKAASSPESAQTFVKTGTLQATQEAFPVYNKPGPDDFVEIKGIKVLCEWIHDDREAQALKSWKHGDKAEPKRTGLRLLSARKLETGHIQIKIWPEQWMFADKIKLRRKPKAPVCSGCRTHTATIKVDLRPCR
ncbi:hypothetical protein CF326_g3214 [Tilletia indica]|nr:hypothetical protein CF326_g3214 [Tilletia indica]